MNGSFRVAARLERIRLVWAGSIALIALIGAFLPQLGALLAPWPHHVFLAVGALDSPRDQSNYIAAIREGMSGQFLFTNPFSARPMTPLLMLPYYLLVGRALSWTALAPEYGYLVARGFAAVLYLAVAWRFSRRHFTCAPVPGFALLVLGGGLSLGGLALLGHTDTGLVSSDLTPYFAMLFTAHQTLSFALQLLVLDRYVTWQETRQTRTLTVLGLYLVLLVLVYPFLVYAVPPALVVATAIQGGRGRTISRLLRALVPALVVALYFAYMFKADPIWRLTGITALPAPDATTLVVTFGPLAVLAGLSLRQRLSDRLVQVCLVFIGAGLIVAFTPLPQASRDVNALFLPLAILAAHGLSSLSSQRARRYLLVVLCASNVLVAVPYFGRVVSHDASDAYRGAYWADSEKIALFHYLVHHVRETDVVLSDYVLSNELAADIFGHLVGGHPSQTPDWTRVAAVLTGFGAASSQGRLRSESVYDVTLIVAGPAWGRGGQTIGSLPNHKRCFVDAAYSVYAIGHCPPYRRQASSSLYQ